MKASAPLPQADYEAAVYKNALLSIITAVNKYLPPDGPLGKKGLISAVIDAVDHWEVVHALGLQGGVMWPKEGKADPCVCHICQKAYVTDLLVPDDVWDKIKPDNFPDGGGLLCPTCIIDRAADRCGWTVGFAYKGRRGKEITAGRRACQPYRSDS